MQIKTHKKIRYTIIFLCVFCISITTHAFYTFPTKIDTKVERMNIQTVLNTVMVPSPNLKVDGVLGRKSIQAIQSFQESHGLTADGKVGPITRNTLETAQTGNTTYTPTTTTGCPSGALYNTQTGKPCNTTTYTPSTGGGTATSTTLTPPITTTIPTPDTTKPTINTFTLPTTSTSLNVPFTLSATDNTGVSGYFLSESSTTPNTSSGSWFTTPSSTYTFISEGLKTLYAWAKDAVGNVSNSLSKSTTITIPTTSTTITAVTSTSNDGHVDTNTLDRVFTDDSRWSAEGNGQTITYELNQISSVSYVNFAFYAATSKYFDIAYSINGTTFTNVSATRFTSAPNMSNQYQPFTFAPVNAKYIRFIGYGSSASLWNSITETDINGFAINLTITPPTVCTPESTTTTCSGKCGTQTNNCGASVSCTACNPGTGDKVVVYYNNFEQNAVGTYTQAERNADWDNCYANNGESIYQNSSDGSNSSKVYKFFFPKGSVSVDSTHGMRCELYPLNPGYDELYLSYKVKFGNGFNAVMGGKLPRIESKTEQSAGAGYCPNGTDFFTGGMMFGNNGTKTSPGSPYPKFYIYHIDQWNSTWYRDVYHDVTGTYPTSCQDFELHTPYHVYGDSFIWGTPLKSCAWNDDYCYGGRSVAELPGGQWHTITERLVANTPGQNDGFVEGYMDGQLIMQVKNFKFRTTPDLKINYFDFVSFFGGDGPDWAAVKDEEIFFDDLMLYYYTPSSGQPSGHTLSPVGRTLPAMNYPSSSILNNH